MQSCLIHSSQVRSLLLRNDANRLELILVILAHTGQCNTTLNKGDNKFDWTQRHHIKTRHMRSCQCEKTRQSANSFKYPEVKGPVLSANLYFPSLPWILMDREGGGENPGQGTF